MAESPAENFPGTLVSQREFAKRRGCSVQAVNRNTVDHGGVIPVHGPRKQVCVEEADRLWPPRTNGAAPLSPVRELDRQRVRKLKADAARSELRTGRGSAPATSQVSDGSGAVTPLRTTRTLPGERTRIEGPCTG